MFYLHNHGYQQNPADEDVLSFHLKVRRRIPFFGIGVVSLKLPDNKNHLFYLICGTYRHIVFFQNKISIFRQSKKILQKADKGILFLLDCGS